MMTIAGKGGGGSRNSQIWLNISMICEQALYSGYACLKPTVPKNRPGKHNVWNIEMFERWEKHWGRVDGWWGQSSKAVLTTQMTWNGRSITFLPHNISSTRMLDPHKRCSRRNGENVWKSPKIFSLLLPLTVSPTQQASHTETRVSKTRVRDLSARQLSGLNKVGRGCLEAIRGLLFLATRWLCASNISSI